MEHDVVILLVEYHAVNHYERLCVDVDRVDALHERHAAHAGCAVAHGGEGVGSKLLLYLFLDIGGATVMEIGS